MTGNLSWGGRANLALLSNEVATGGPQEWRGGTGSFVAHAGTWGGATVKLQFLGPDGATWIDADAGASTTPCTLTADGGGNFQLPPGFIRAAVTGGPPTAVYASAISHA